MLKGKCLVILVLLIFLTIPSFTGSECTTCSKNWISANVVSVTVDTLDLQNQFVKITNNGPYVVSLNVWSLKNQDSSIKFVFPHFLLNGGSSVLVFAGNGIDSNTALYTHNMFDAWNTNGDTAYLYDSQGNLISQRYQGPIPTPTPTPAPTISPEKNLVAYYSFDDGTARDDSGNYHDGSIIGATEISGVRGKALFFDGKTDYVKLPFIFQTDPKQVTVMAFIRTTSESPTRQYSFYNGNYEFGLVDSNRGSNGVCTKLYKEASTNNWHCAGGSFTADGTTWVHETGVIDTINHNIKYYQDGILVDYQSLPDDVFGHPSGYYTSIGAFDSLPLGKKDFFSGAIDEVRVYNRVLSDDEIYAIYKNYFPNPTPTSTKTPTITPTSSTPIPTQITPTITAQPTSSGLKAAFSASPGTGSFPLEVRFSDQSTGNPNTWTWNFGDGSYSNEKNPVHLYGDVGTYTVNLQVTGSGGSSSSEKPGYIVVTDPLSPPPFVPTIVPTTPITAIPTIVPTPTATILPTITPTPTTGKLVGDFTSNVRSGSSPLQVSFYDKSSGQPDKWFWSFGDGSYSEEQNPAHTYADQMTYLVSLEVKKQGLASVIAKENWITIN
jgi:PKD repeat protein